jgi:Putative Ig domain
MRRGFARRQVQRPMRTSWLAFRHRPEKWELPITRWLPSVVELRLTFFSLASGTLPPGMTPNSRAGSILGVPTVAGNYTFVVSVSDSSNTEHGSGTARVSVGPAKVPPG